MLAKIAETTQPSAGLVTDAEQITLSPVNYSKNATSYSK